MDSPWGSKESNTTERLSLTSLNYYIQSKVHGYTVKHGEHSHNFVITTEYNT